MIKQPNGRDGSGDPFSGLEKDLCEEIEREITSPAESTDEKSARRNTVKLSVINGSETQPDRTPAQKNSPLHEIPVLKENEGIEETKLLLGEIENELFCANRNLEVKTGRLGEAVEILRRVEEEQRVSFDRVNKELETIRRANRKLQTRLDAVLQEHAIATEALASTKLQLKTAQLELDAFDAPDGSSGEPRPTA